MALGGVAYSESAYKRRIELLDASLSVLAVLCDFDDSIDYVESAKFELLRQGGCGPGQFQLNDEFPGTNYATFDLGQYIRCRWAEDGDPVYLGRIEEINDDSPSGVQLRTQGPMARLNEIQVGGFDSDDQQLPHLFAASENRFIYDPDFALQSWDFCNTIPGFVQLLFDRYIDPQTNITLGTIDPFTLGSVAWNSGVFRGQENLSQIICTLAVQQTGASYGVNASNEFFFIPRATTELHTFQEGQHLTKLSKNLDKDLLYNKLIITGDYGYLPFPGANTRFYRWVSAHANLSSIAAYGSKKIILYVPWIRTQGDADSFADGFFDIYGEPRVRFNATTIPQGAIMNPWDGSVGLLGRTGGDLVRSERFDRIEVTFDKAPFFAFTTGPEDLQWPVAPEPQRWELPAGGGQGEPDSSFFFPSSSEVDESASEGRSDYEYCPPGGVQVIKDFTVRCSDGNLVVEKEYVCVKCFANSLGHFALRM